MHILLQKMMTSEDCPSPDAAPVFVYWLLRRRQPPYRMGRILGQGGTPCPLC